MRRKGSRPNVAKSYFVEGGKARFWVRPLVCFVDQPLGGLLSSAHALRLDHRKYFIRLSATRLACALRQCENVDPAKR
jgi:hypothetical protein